MTAGLLSISRVSETRRKGGVSVCGDEMDKDDTEQTGEIVTKPVFDLSDLGEISAPHWKAEKEDQKRHEMAMVASSLLTFLWWRK